MNESERNQKYSGRQRIFSDRFFTGWYRYGGRAGTKMSTSCVPALRCGTNGAGWMNGTHPTVFEGKVMRKVCYSVAAVGCCWASNNIEVMNCGQYYIYKLPSSGCSPCRYCGSD